MPETPQPPTYLSTALGAFMAEVELEHPGIIARARKRLKREADRSIVWGLHGEHETAADKLEHDRAVVWLGRLIGVVGRLHAGKPKRSGRKRA